MRDKEKTVCYHEIRSGLKRRIRIIHNKLFIRVLMNLIRQQTHINKY